MFITKPHRWLLTFFTIGTALLLLACQDSAPTSEDHQSTEAGGHAHSAASIELEPRAELEMDSPIPLDPSVEKSKEIGFVYQAFLSPEQQGGEEAETPDLIPEVFRSTKGSVDREDRPSRYR